MKIVANNKKAYFNYFIHDTFQAGMSLKGSEVKSIRAGHVSLNDSFVSIVDGQVLLKNAYIKAYEKATSFVPDERRPRVLLLNKKEINKLARLVREKGYTIVPTKMYFNDSLVKLEIAVAQGKHLYDKKEVLKEKDQQLDLKRELDKYKK
ncbi:MAG: SsrA-binding protein SmpB [Spirochaetales bacterium]